MTDGRQRGLDFINHIPTVLRGHDNASEPTPLARALAKRGHAVFRNTEDNAAELRSVDHRARPSAQQTTIYAEPVAMAMRRALAPESGAAALALRYRHSFGIPSKSAFAVGVAALVALAGVVVYPALHGSSDPEAASAAPLRQTFPVLAIRNVSGPVNEPLSLGVDVNAPSAGSTVTIGRIPSGARLTVGKQISSNEWRVAAQEISGAAIIPPADFVGVLYLTAELRGSDEAPLASSLVQLNWTSASRGGAVRVSASAAAPGQQPRQRGITLGPPRAEPAATPKREIKPGEVAEFIRRAKERLDDGDLHAARLLLLRAAEAHDPRAALSLAKTFDPAVSKQSGAAVQDADLTQARNWYLKAQEWGSTEAQRQLDALASYR